MWIYVNPIRLICLSNINKLMFMETKLIIYMLPHEYKSFMNIHLVF